MFNVGGGEVLVIMLVALLVLGPQKLPEAARQVAAMARELRKVSSGFQAEMRAALDDPIEEAARDRGRTIVSSEQAPSPDEDEPRDDDVDSDDTAETTDPNAPVDDDGRPISTAAAAGMYDVGTTRPGGDQARTDGTDDNPTDDNQTDDNRTDDNPTDDA